MTELLLPDLEWPSFGLVDDVRPALADVTSRGHPAALVTLFAADGGAPRGIGAQMLVAEDRAVGFLSGGCLEADVVRHGMDTIRTLKPKRLVYGRGGPVDIQLPCGGRIEVLIEPVPPHDESAAELLALRTRRQPALWVTDGSARACLHAGQSPILVPAALQPALYSAGRTQAIAGFEAKSGAVFRRYSPQHRVVVIGGDPTAMAIASLAIQAGLETFVVRPKGPAEPPPIPGICYLPSSSPAALAAIGLDAWTAVAVATHDEIDDHEALGAALTSDAGYVGLLGSRRRLSRRLDMLRLAALPEAAIARLHAPIGLDLGSSSPWQIGLGVVAEVCRALNAVTISAHVGSALDAA